MFLVMLHNATGMMPCMPFMHECQLSQSLLPRSPGSDREMDSKRPASLRRSRCRDSFESLNTCMHEDQRKIIGINTKNSPRAAGKITRQGTIRKHSWFVWNILRFCSVVTFWILFALNRGRYVTWYFRHIAGAHEFAIVSVAVKKWSEHKVVNCVQQLA